MLQTTAQISEAMTRWIAAGSIVAALLSLCVTLVALTLSARAVRDAQRENRLAKEMERELAADERAYKLLQTVAGGGDAIQISPSTGAPYRNFTTQQMAVALLTDYPRSANGLRGILRAHNQFIESGRATDPTNLQILNTMIEDTLRRFPPEEKSKGR